MVTGPSAIFAVWARAARRALWLVVCAAAMSMSANAQQRGAPQRIASINLCADQHLLALADPSQIKGLSPFARDAARSWLARQAMNHPRLSGHAEDVLMLGPDLVVAGRFTKRQTREILRAKGLRVEEFDAVTSIDDAKKQIARFGALIGRADIAAQQNAAIDAAVG